MFDNSDEYDFNPTGSSQLASLFDNPSLALNSKSSLMYIAPKQPKPKKGIDANDHKLQPTTTVLLVKIIALWKLDNKDYKSLGKHGLALIGSTDLNLFEIICYKEKNNVLFRAKVNKDFNFYNQKNGFSSFYDNESKNWLVKFENEDQDNFCKQIQAYDANIFNDIEESTRNTGNTEEFLVSSKSVTSKPDLLPKPVEKQVEDHNSYDSESQKKANILNRMAKMGQQIVPSQSMNNVNSDISDSELDDSKNSREITPHIFKRAYHSKKNVSLEEKLQVMPQNFYENQMIHESMNFNPSQTISNPMYYNHAAKYDGFSHYIVAQNTELKMNLAQISEKLDTVLGEKNVGTDKDDTIVLKSKMKVLELKTENLQIALEEYKEKYQVLQLKYTALEQKNYNEKKENDILINNLREEADKLRADLSAAKENIRYIEKLESVLKDYKNDIEKYISTIEIQKLKLKDLEEFYEQNKNNSLNDTIETLNNTISNLKLKIKDFEEYFNKNESEKQQQIHKSNDKINMFDNIIKRHMNDMYQSVLSNFNEETSYSFSEVQANIAQNLKRTTFKIIEDVKNVYRQDCNILNN